METAVFYTAVNYGDCILVDSLLTDNPQLIQCLDLSCTDSPDMMAVLLRHGFVCNEKMEILRDAGESGNVETFRFLVESGFNDEGCGFSILHCAIRDAYPTECIEILLQHQADISKLVRYDDPRLNGCNAIMLAAMSGNYETLKYVLENSQDLNINHMNSNGDTALSIAVTYATLNMVELLLLYGAVVNNDSREPILHTAISSRNINMFRLLLAVGAKPTSSTRKHIMCSLLEPTSWLQLLK